MGTAVGDALGLPYEGLSPRRAEKLLGAPDRFRFLFGRGMVSDDTEHACMTTQALMAAGDDVQRFVHDLAWRLRFWLLGLPAGVGLATLKATVRLWLGFPPQRSGVFSAGNGPAMRSVVLGTAIDDVELLRRLVTASTRLTHSDPKADYGAFAVALAARMASSGQQPDAARFAAELHSYLPDTTSAELLALVDRMVVSVTSGESTENFVLSMGWRKGVSGYIYQTVPAVLHAWLSHPLDFRAALTSVIRCGGDADTTGAILGGIVGSAVGKGGIPSAWLDRLAEWPRSVAWMERLGEELVSARTKGESCRPPRLALVPLLLRNLLFLAVVLGHGFRRLLPPY